MTPEPIRTSAPLLAIDAGNSRVKARVHTPEGPGPSAAIERAQLESPEGRQLLAGLLRHGHPIREAVISCARPADEEVLSRLLGPMGLRAAFLHRADPSPVPHCYRSGGPGPDRIAVAMALRHLFPGRPALCIDFGTATNTVVTDGSGRFLGGAILPGVRLQADSLHRATDGRLPAITLREGESFGGGFAEDTPGTMALGILVGHAGAADGLIAHHRRVSGGEVALVATGGNAPLVLPLMREKPECIPALVLDGLAVWGGHGPGGSGQG